MLRVLAFFVILMGVLIAATPAEAAWPAAGDTVCYVGHVANSVYMAPDGSGGILPMWTGYGGGYMPVGGVSRVSSAGVIHPGWRFRFCEEDPRFDQASNPRSFPDGLGGVFRRFLESSDSTWRLQHIPPNGGGLDPSWPAGGVRLGRGSYALLPPIAQHDGSGGAYVVVNPAKATNWYSPTDSLLVKHVLANGTLDPAWPLGGLRINNPGDVPGNVYDEYLFSVPDGAGGAIVLWMGQRFRAQRVTSTGIAAGWPAGGLVLRDVPDGDGMQLMALTASGSDHFLAAWSAGCGGATCIRIQRFHRDGTIASGWPTTAVLAYTYANQPQSTRSARMITDGSTGVYLAFHDGGQLIGLRVLEDGSIANGWGPGGLVLTDPGAMVSSADRGPEYDIASNPGRGPIVTWLDGRTPNNTDLRVRWLLADGSPDPNQPPSRVVVPGGTYPAAGMTAALGDGVGGVYVEWAGNGGPDAGYISDLVMLSWMPYDSSLVGVPPMPQARTLALTAWPNPARDNLEVEFTLAGGSRARLDLLDISGRRVRSFEARGAGPHIAKVANLGDIAPGVYLLRLQEGNAVRTTRVALIH